MRYVQYARAFNWTPDQVDSIPLRLDPWLLPINAVIEKDCRRRQQAEFEAAKKAAANGR